MKTSIVEVYAPGGRFLLTQLDRSAICEGILEPGGFQNFNAVSALPPLAKEAVFLASSKISDEPHRFIFRPR